MYWETLDVDFKFRFGVLLIAYVIIADIAVNCKYDKLLLINTKLRDFY